MAVSPARAAAFQILLRVEREQSFAIELLHSERASHLSPADHGLATELVMGVLRWRSWLDDRIAEVASQKLERLDLEVLTALRLAIYQIEFLSRIPARAAIFESVEIVKSARKRSAATFVNAVLRKLAGARVTASSGSHDSTSDASSSDRGLADPASTIFESDDPVALARNSAHPEWLIRRWVQHYGIHKVRQMCAYNQHPPATALRIVADKESFSEVLNELEDEGVRFAPGKLLQDSRIVVSGDVTRTKAYRRGKVAIQDEGSQLVALLVGRGERILDCCAAPGGKTSVMAERNPTSQVLALDVHSHRARLLRRLVRLPNVRAVAADARQLPFAASFDRILADVPCSGTGTLARNPEIKWRLRAEDLADLQSRQAAILKSALAQLAPGGRLIYSTCSMEPEENESVVQTVLASSTEYELIDCRAELENLLGAGELCAEIESLLAGPYLRTIPGVHPCDGFFAAILKKAA